MSTTQTTNTEACAAEAAGLRMRSTAAGSAEGSFTDRFKADARRRMMEEETAIKKAAGARDAPEEPKEVTKEKVMEDLQDIFAKMQKGPKPGLSDPAKKAKDELAKDPYNMGAIFELGIAYSADEKWNECANVMMRGWKRVKEFEDPQVQFEFLTILCQASFRTRKFRQAFAILNDIDLANVPVEANENGHFDILKTQVYCYNGDQAKGLKSFHSATEGRPFMECAMIWASCAAGLKKVNLYEATRSTILDMAPTEEDKAKFEAMEKLAEIKDAFQQEIQEGNPLFGKQKHLLIIAIVFSLSIFCAVLTYLESQSLASLKLKSK